MNKQIRKILIILFTLTLCACTLLDGGKMTEDPSAGHVEKGVAWVDYDSTKIIVKESFPMQVEMTIYGDLPTPCHELKWEVADPDENKAIHVNVYSEVDTSERCAQMLEPFEQRIPLGDFEDTGYTIYINDYKVGEF